MNLIQPKKGKGILRIGDNEFDSTWAALGIANYGPTSNQKGFLLVKTSEETYAFVGNEPFQKIIGDSVVKATTISKTGSWQWRLPVAKIINIARSKESFEFQGEVLADRKEGVKDAYIYVSGKIKDGIFANCAVDLQFEQIQELPPIKDQTINI